jgi:uncharacterized damage-inducible protein DinB
LYDSHTTLYPNVIESISEKDTHNRLNTKANHIAWIAGSLVHMRYDLAYAVGLSKDDIKENSRSYELFKDYKGIQDSATYPSLDEYRRDWKIISPALKDHLSELSDDALNAPDPFQMPGKDLTLLDSITFFIDRESYCIGQIGLYRRLLGYEAMKYN